MNVLITGFDPFGGEPINPAWEAVKAMKDEIAGATITKLQIPTVVAKSIAKVHEKMQELRPDIVISIGQAGGRFGVTPERVATSLTPGSRITKETSPSMNRSLQMEMPLISPIFR